MRPWTDGITLPVLIDPQHVLTEVYAISNVPAVVWIDEDDHIVRPNGVAFSNDMFKEFTGAESGPHLEALRAWVRDGTVPMTDADAARPRCPTSPTTRCWRGSTSGWVSRPVVGGDDAGSRRHLERAGELAPLDFTIRRAAMPLLGGDPFGGEFMELYGEWKRPGVRSTASRR